MISPTFIKVNIKQEKTKSRHLKGNGLLVLCKLDSAGYFTRTQATGAGVDILGRTVYDSLNALDIGLPAAVGPPMRMGNLDAKGHAFATTITLCHLLHLLVFKSPEYNTRPGGKMQAFFKNIWPKNRKIRVSPCAAPPNKV